MISRIDLRGDALPEGGALRDLLPRAEFDVEAALEKVRPICEDVHHRGTAALIEYARKFDGVELTQVRVPAQALTAALEQLDPAVRAAWRSPSGAPVSCTATSAAPSTPPRWSPAAP